MKHTVTNVGMLLMNILLNMVDIALKKITDDDFFFRILINFIVLIIKNYKNHIGLVN